MRRILLTLPLDQHWRCQFYRGGDSVDETQNTAIILPLSAWAADPGRPVATLDHNVRLSPIEAECVSYWLQVDSAPQGTQVLVNQKLVGEVRGGKALEFDVTNYVALGLNWIMFRVEGEPPGRFGAVRLVATP
ncbi:MAG: hypothetical protein U0694_29060, partial [Anaerolineae bacterium]